jgi:protein subunit release factor A
LNVESVIVELRAGEGGEDARLLVGELLAIYGRYAKLESL